MAKNAASDLLDLITAQIKLARLELASDARDAALRAIRVLAFSIPVVVGYGFAMAAAASALSRALGWPLALLAVAAIQLAIGLLGIRSAIRGKGPMGVLDRSAAQAESTVVALTALAKTAAPSDSRKTLL